MRNLPAHIPKLPCSASNTRIWPENALFLTNSFSTIHLFQREIWEPHLDSVSHDGRSERQFLFHLRTLKASATANPKRPQRNGSDKAWEVKWEIKKRGTKPGFYVSFSRAPLINKQWGTTEKGEWPPPPKKKKNVATIDKIT